MLSPMPNNTLSPLPLMELATGFWSFKTLASAYELGLFEQLSGTSGTTAGELADRLGIASRPAEMLLTGCAALGVLQKQDGRYVNSPLSDEYLVPGKPNHFGGLVTWHTAARHADRLLSVNVVSTPHPRAVARR